MEHTISDRRPSKNDPSAPFKDLLIDLSEKLRPEDIDELTFCTGSSSEGKQSNIKILERLWKEGEFSPRDSASLKKLLERIKRFDLVELVTNYDAHRVASAKKRDLSLQIKRTMDSSIPIRKSSTDPPSVFQQKFLAQNDQMFPQVRQESAGGHSELHLSSSSLPMTRSPIFTPEHRVLDTSFPSSCPVKGDSFLSSSGNFTYSPSPERSRTLSHGTRHSQQSVLVVSQGMSSQELPPVGEMYKSISSYSGITAFSDTYSENVNDASTHTSSVPNLPCYPQCVSDNEEMEEGALGSLPVMYRKNSRKISKPSRLSTITDASHSTPRQSISIDNRRISYSASDPSLKRLSDAPSVTHRSEQEVSYKGPALDPIDECTNQPPRQRSSSFWKKLTHFKPRDPTEPWRVKREELIKPVWRHKDDAHITRPTKYEVDINNGKYNPKLIFQLYPYGLDRDKESAVTMAVRVVLPTKCPLPLSSEITLSVVVWEDKGGERKELKNLPPVTNDLNTSIFYIYTVITHDRLKRSKCKYFFINITVEQNTTV